MNSPSESASAQLRRVTPNWQELQRYSPKFFRAYELLATYRDELMRHLPHAWRSVEIEPTPGDPQSEDLVVRDVTDEQLILDWAVLLGDAVHNARSALDHAVWQLVGMNGATPNRSNQFPTAPSEGKFKPHSLDGVHPDVKDAIRALEPWERGAGHWLWVLTQLDNVDKHRLLLDVTSTSNSNISVRDPASGRWSDEWVSTEGRELGDVIRTAPIGSMTRKMSSSTLRIAHHDGDDWDGNGPQGWPLPAETTLELCLSAVREALNAMGRAAIGAGGAGV